MTMTFSSSISQQLNFDHTSGLTSTSTSRSRSTRPNRTTRKRSLLDDKQTTYSIMNRENLLGIMQVPSLTRLIGKYANRNSNSNIGTTEQDLDEVFHDATDDMNETTGVEARTTTAASVAIRQEQTNMVDQGKSTMKRDWQLEQKYTLSEVQCHNTLDDCWMVIFDKVYNITDFVLEHPGGDFILFEYAGRDATRPFLSSRHGSSAHKMLDKYWIGILVDEELYYSNNSSYCSVYLDLSWRSTPTLEESTNSSSESTSQTSSSSNLSE